MLAMAELGHSRRFRHVRLSPDSDDSADIPDRQLRAKTCREQLQQMQPIRLPRRRGRAPCIYNPFRVGNDRFFRALLKVGRAFTWDGR
jgi:hypothetical protein